MNRYRWLLLLLVAMLFLVAAECNSSDDDETVARMDDDTSDDDFIPPDDDDDDTGDDDTGDDDTGDDDTGDDDTGDDDTGDDDTGDDDTTDDDTTDDDTTDDDTTDDDTTDDDTTDDDTTDDDTTDDDTTDDDTTDDDTTDDDTIDDDTIDDDTIDDDTTDDDTIDDDTIDDDTTDDDTTDDDTTDDDTGDDDTTVLEPEITINAPLHGSTLSTYDIVIDVDILYCDLADNVTITLDGQDITDYLTVTNTFVAGTITASMGGTFTLRVEATNDNGAGFAESTFAVNKPWVKLNEPEVGAYLFKRNVDVDANYGNCSATDITVTLDGTDITASLVIFNGNITGTLEMLTEGVHTIVIRAEKSGDVAEVSAEFTIELLEPHFDLSLSATQIGTGEFVDVTYVFYDESGEDITSSVDPSLGTDPTTGVVIDVNRIYFYFPGFFAVQVSTIYNLQVYTAETYVLVDQTEIYSLDITVSDSDIDAGDTIAVDADIIDVNGNPVMADVIYTVDPPFGVTFNLPNITLTYAGTITVRGQVAGTNVYDEETVVVHPNDPAEITIYCSQPSVAQGETVTCNANVVDIYGNATDDAWALEIVPGTGWTMVGNDITFQTAGGYSITARVTAHPTIFDVTFVQVVDVTPPDIVFTSPPRGYYTQTGSVTVSGYVYDVDPYNATLKINDSFVFCSYHSPTSVSFSEQYALTNGLNIFTAEANDGIGNMSYGATSVLYGQAEWPNDSWITNAAGFRITDTGLNQVEDVIDSYLATIDFKSIIMSYNPLFDERAEVWGVTVASARADVTNVTNTTPWVTLDSNPNAIDTYAGIGQMRLDYRVRGSIVGIGYSITGYTEVTNVIANAFAYISVNNDNILVNISDFNVNIGNFEFNINGFPDILLEPFEWAVRELVEWLVPGLIEPYIQSTLDDLLEDIPYSFDIPVSDITFTFEARPYSAVFDSVGGTIWLKGRTLTDTINPAVPAFSGSIRTDNVEPVFTTSDYGFAVLVSDNMVNQILYQAFRSGLLHVDLEDVIPDACDAIFYAIFPDICDTYGAIPLTMKVRPLLPPVFIPYVDKAGTLNVQVQMGDAFIHLYNANPPEDLLLTLSASVIAPATLTHDSGDNTFNISFDTPQVVVDTINNPLSLNETLFEQLAPTLVELFLPLLSSLIGDIALPALDENWILTVNDMTNMGYHDNFIAVTGGIAPAKSAYAVQPAHD